MPEDDIVYMGSNTLSRNPSTNDPFPDQRPLIGIALHVQPSDDQPRKDLVFYNSQNASVNIGRRPGSDTEDKSGDSDKNEAMFKCPVISRKHARIVFSANRQVYLMDLHSHHGTHILKRGATVSSAIEPEVPVLLADGDTVTFGKSVNVGKGNEKSLVQPVIVHVELLHGNSSATPNPHSVLRLLSQVSKEGGDSQECVMDSRASPKTSGRYGLYPSSASSDDDSSSKSESDHDSDIEEIEPPQKPNPHPQPIPPISTTHNAASFNFSAFEVLKRLLPPAHKPELPCVSPPSEPSAAHSNKPSPDPLELPPLIEHAPYPPTWFSSVVHENDDLHLEEIEDDKGENKDENRLRTTSPMDLSSPSPVPEHCSWPASRSVSPVPSLVSSPLSTSCQVKEALRPGDALSEDPAAAAEDLAKINRSGGEDVVPKLQSSALSMKVGGTHVSENADEDNDEDMPTEVSPDVDLKAKELNTTLERIRVDVDKLQVHKRKYKARFNQNVHTIAERLRNLEDQQATLADQINALANLDVPDIQDQVDELQDMVDALGPIVKEGVADALGERDDVKEGVATLNALVEEMKTLRDRAEKEIAAEVEGFKAVRSIAVAALEAEVQCPSSLKRKRSLSEDQCFGCSDCRDSNSSIGVQPSTSQSTLLLSEEGIKVPKPKRARRILSVVVQTTTAVTIGAAITWSALAFS